MSWPLYPQTLHLPAVVGTVQELWSCPLAPHNEQVSIRLSRSLIDQPLSRYARQQLGCPPAASADTVPGRIDRGGLLPSVHVARPWRTLDPLGHGLSGTLRVRTNPGERHTKSAECTDAEELECGTQRVLRHERDC